MTTAVKCSEELSVKNLQELFPPLEKFDLHVLFPLFDRLIVRFIECVSRIGSQSHSMRFCCGSNLIVTDVCHKGNKGAIFSVSGNIIEMQPDFVALPHQQNRKCFRNVKFLCTNKKILNGFIDMIKGFILRQNLYVLRAEIASELDTATGYGYCAVEKVFYENLNQEQWMPEMTAGLTPELVLMVMFEYCNAFFPQDWQPILEVMYEAQQEHRFLSLLGLQRQEDGKIVSPIFDHAIRYLLDNGMIYVAYMAPKPIKPEYGETRLRVSNIPEPHYTSEKRHHDLIWTPCYNLGRRLTELFGSEK